MPRVPKFRALKLPRPPRSLKLRNSKTVKAPKTSKSKRATKIGSTSSKTKRRSNNLRENSKTVNQLDMKGKASNLTGPSVGAGGIQGFFDNIQRKIDEKEDEIKVKGLLPKTSKVTPDSVNNNDDEVIYKCEYLPVDTDDKVQVLQVPLGSRGYNSLVGDEVSNVFVSNTIFICFVLLIFFIGPLLHGFLKSLVRSSTFLDNIKSIQTYLNIDINLLNLILVLLLVLLTLILLIYGLVVSDRTAISIAMFLPFFGLVSYIGIMFFKRSSSEASASNSPMIL